MSSIKKSIFSFPLIYIIFITQHVHTMQQLKLHDELFVIPNRVLRQTKVLHDIVKSCQDKNSTIDITPGASYTNEQFRLFLSIARHCAEKQISDMEFSLWPQNAASILDLANRFDNQKVLYYIAQALVNNFKTIDLINFLYNKGSLFKFIQETPIDIQNSILKKLFLKKYTQQKYAFALQKEKIISLKQDSRIEGIIELNDDTFIAGAKQKIKFFNSATGHCFKKISHQHSYLITQIIKLKNGNFATCSENGIIKLFDGNMGGLLTTFPHLSNKIYWHEQHIICEIGEHIFSMKGGIPSQKNCYLWNQKTKQDAYLGYGSLIEPIKKNQFAVADHHLIKIYDIAKSLTPNIVQTHYSNPKITCMTKLRKGCLAVGYKNYTDAPASIKIWSIKKALCLSTGIGHQQDICAILALNNGLIASGSADKTIKIWDFQGNCLNTLKGHYNSVYILTNLKNGKFASAANDNLIKIWCSNTFQCLATLKGHTDCITKIIPLKNGNLVSASYDETIKIWPLTALDSCNLQQLLFGFGLFFYCNQKESASNRKKIYRKLDLSQKEFAHAKKIYAKLPQDVKNTVKSYVTE